MDFTGSVGRIVHDPVEAKEIKLSEEISINRRSIRRQISANQYESIAESYINQPWFHRSINRADANALIRRQGNLNG